MTLKERFEAVKSSGAEVQRPKKGGASKAEIKEYA